MNSLVKIGPFGSTSEAEGNCDITVAPLRLESITIRHGLIVDALAFTYKDCHGLQHTTGQWGGDGGNSTTITLGPDEFVTGVQGLYGSYSYGGNGVTDLTIVTNLRAYGAFGVRDSIKEA
ncbi:protein GOS9-like [Panicum miliaceum]|uniref:Protein GOS9-like n=1 Tax=Panicum miliaceum TaxID=4540 RepID=A0A3L6SX53_PANMI|nr:protein GOS9-like [Panicum miliaceum]